MLRALPVLMLVSSAALASDYSLRLQTDTTSDSFALSDCNQTIAMQWLVAPTVITTTLRSYTSSMTVWSTSGSCGDTPGTGDVHYSDITLTDLVTLSSGTFTVKVAELPAFQVAATSCGTPNINVTQYICGAISFTSPGITTTQVYHVNSLKLVYDRQPPSAPVLTLLKAQDAAIRLEYSVDSDVTNVIAEYREQGTADFIAAPSDDATKLFTRITGLLNGTTYDVRLRAVDSSGNQSAPSDALATTPIRTYGFWGAYKDAGGTEQGCHAVPGSFGALVLAMWLRRGATRRRRS